MFQRHRLATQSTMLGPLPSRNPYSYNLYVCSMSITPSYLLPISVKLENHDLKLDNGQLLLLPAHITNNIYKTVNICRYEWTFSLLRLPPEECSDPEDSESDSS